MPKYLLIGGYVKSASDGDLHFVSAPQLRHLYNLAPQDCTLLPHSSDIGDTLRGLNIDDYTVLKPDPTGAYTVPPLKKAEPPMASPAPDDLSLCDECGEDHPANDTKTCACGLQICIDCEITHECQ